MTKTVDLTVPAGLLEAIAEYMLDRPYREVQPLMDGLKMVKRHEVASELTPEREMPQG